MCAIFGLVNDNDPSWIQAQTDKALERGKDLTSLTSEHFRLFHTRLATNDSSDKYPIEINSTAFAMNGIVSENRYRELAKRYGPIGYTVDSAYMLQHYLILRDWSIFDDEDFVFAFWFVENGKLILGNKDFPLFYAYGDGKFRFSSFSEPDFLPLGNLVLELDPETQIVTERYRYKNLIYAQ